MAGWRRAIELALSEEDVTRLGVVARSRTEPASRVERARILLAYWEDRLNLACRKAKELGYPHGLWTTRLLARHAREQGPAEGHSCLAKLAQGTLCNILNGQKIKSHKVRYYLERRDPQFKQKMAPPALGQASSV